MGLLDRVCDPASTDPGPAEQDSETTCRFNLPLFPFNLIGVIRWLISRIAYVPDLLDLPATPAPKRQTLVRWSLPEGEAEQVEHEQDETEDETDQDIEMSDATYEDDTSDDSDMMEE